MKGKVAKLLVASFVVMMSVWVGHGQVSSFGSIVGTVTDPAGAVVAGATVVVKNNSLSTESTFTTSDNGTFNVPSLNTGLYTITVTASGFKTAVVTDVKVDVGKPSSQNVTLEVGTAAETVTVVGSGELLQTQSANVANTITGRQITDLPMASRNALDIVLFLPGTATVGRPRQSSVNGLPKGAINITLDGVSVQDPLLKNSDGFFTYIQPKTDAISEVTSSTSTPGAESAGNGAVQIKFATRQGSPEFHGSVYMYHRNSYFNSNYWFNNALLPRDPVDGTAPKNRVLLTQPGVRIGGPIRFPGLIKNNNTAFFFINYEEFRLPESVTRTRTVLAPAALTGNFSWIRTSTVVDPLCTQINATQQQCTRNLLTFAATQDCDLGTPGLQPCPSTRDATVGSLLDAINASTTGGSITPNTGLPNENQFTFVNLGFQKRQFPTVNLTWNINKNHQVTNVYNYQIFRTKVDFLNNADPRFPGFPNHGAQNSNRFSDAATLVSKLGTSMSNEFRGALVGGTVVFFPDVDVNQFTNQGGFTLGITSGSTPNITTATATGNVQRRNGPVQTINDTLSWSRGNHALSIGGGWTRTNAFIQFLPSTSLVRTVGFGLDTTTTWSNNPPVFDCNPNQTGVNACTGDPAALWFTTANFPNASANQLTEARAIYATLIGRVNTLSGTATADEKLNYSINGSLTERAGQQTWSGFVQDQWRFRPNITINGGVRYELQGPYYAKNNAYTVPLSYNNIFGCSGPNNFFNPSDTNADGINGGVGVSNGCTNPITQLQRLAPGSKAYNTDRNNFAPNLGIAYSPEFKSGLMHVIFGDSGQSVLRAGFSVAFTQDGTNVGSTGLDINPGQSFSIARAVTNDTVGNTGTCSTCIVMGSLLRNGLPPPVLTAPTFPFTPGVNDQVNAFNPNLRVGYVMSWQGSYQREFMKDTVFEARYVGNRAHKLTRLWFINEVNTRENGFAAEFALAQANLFANNLFPGGTHAGSFAYFGPGTGTSPLPIFFAYLQGNVGNPGAPGNYTSGNWTATAITNNLTGVAPSVTGVAGTLSASAGLRANAVLAGLGRNFFVVNPDVPNGAFTIDNGAQSTYDALQIELRRRLSKGLLVQASYTWSKAMSDAAASSSFAQSNYVSLRNPRLNRTLSPYDISHNFKADFIYELPFGTGKTLFGSVGKKTNWLVGGWGINGTARIQSGSPINLGPVQLVGMTRKELQHALKIRKDPVLRGIVYYLPDDIIQNTIKAFTVAGANATNATNGYGSAGAPVGRFIAPTGYGNCQASYNGQCGLSNVILYGPHFTRFDLSVAKKVTFSENKNLEFRVEFLNAFNNINFKVGSFANDVTSLAGTFSGSTFGQTNVAYQDTSTTTDPGGRLVQFVLRFNF